MVVSEFKSDLYETGVATVTNYATAGAARPMVKIQDASKVAFIVISGASNATDYKIQVNNLLSPLNAEASPGWADWIAESTVAAGASEATSYDNPGFRWCRIIQQLDTVTDNATFGISTLRDKAGY